MNRRTSSIGAGLRVDGHLAGDGNVQVYGHFEGTVHIGGQLTVGLGAVVRAEVVATQVTVEGYLEGPVRTTRSVRIGPRGVLQGDVVGELQIDPGGVHRGKLTVARPLPTTNASAGVPTPPPLDSSHLFAAPFDVPSVPHSPVPRRPTPPGDSGEPDPTDLPEDDGLPEPSVRTLTSPGARVPAEPLDDVPPPHPDLATEPPEAIEDEEPPRYHTGEFDPAALGVPAEPSAVLGPTSFDPDRADESEPPLPALPEERLEDDPTDLPRGPTRLVIPNPPVRRTTSPGATPFRKSFSDTGSHPVQPTVSTPQAALPRPRPISSGRLPAVDDPLAQAAISGSVRARPKKAEPEPPQEPVEPASPEDEVVEAGGTGDGALAPDEDPDLTHSWFVDEDEDL